MHLCYHFQYVFFVFFLSILLLFLTISFLILANLLWLNFLDFIRSHIGMRRIERAYLFKYIEREKNHCVMPISTFISCGSMCIHWLVEITSYCWPHSFSEVWNWRFFGSIKMTLRQNEQFGFYFIVSFFPALRFTETLVFGLISCFSRFQIKRKQGYWTECDLSDVS